MGADLVHTRRTGVEHGLVILPLDRGEQALEAVEAADEALIISTSALLWTCDRKGT